MKINFMGHAGLLVEAGQSRVLVDPILHDDLLAGGFIGFSAWRKLDRAAMPAPTSLVITHRHFDHFDPISLKLLDRTLPVFVPRDGGLITRLNDLGFTKLHVLDPWRKVEHDGLTLLATPSDAELSEMGIFMGTSQGSLWNMVDTEANAAVARQLRQSVGGVDVVMVKYQPAESSYSPFRNLGATFPKANVVEPLEAACLVQPKLAIPGASGLRYFGRHEWMNRFAFPLSPQEVATLLGQRLGASGRGCTVLPGDVVTVASGDVSHSVGRAGFIEHDPARSVQPIWEPFDQSTLAVLDGESEEQELTSEFGRFLREDFGPWMLSRTLRAGSPYHKYKQHQVIWQVAIHLSAEKRLYYSLDFADTRLALRPERHPMANFFVHLSGRALLDFFRGIGTRDCFYLGDARFYEKVLGVREGRFWAPEREGWALFEELKEPLTEYLRYWRKRN